MEKYAMAVAADAVAVATLKQQAAALEELKMHAAKVSSELNSNAPNSRNLPFPFFFCPRSWCCNKARQQMYNTECTDSTGQVEKV
jgi:hypothetical protein